MDDIDELLLHHQKIRFAVLRTVFKLAGGNPFVHVGEQKIREVVECADGEFEAAVFFLMEYDLLTASSAGLKLTAEGVQELDASIITPDQATRHFAAAVVQHFHGNVSVVNTGGDIHTQLVERETPSRGKT